MAGVVVNRPAGSGGFIIEEELPQEYPAIVINPAAPSSQERRRWEMFHTAYGAPGRPYEKYRTEFPKLVYRAKKIPGSGKWSVGCADDTLFPPKRDGETDMGAAERFSVGCYTEAGDEDHFRRLLAEGWAPGPKEALEDAEKGAKSKADDAARRLYEDRNMSPAAQAFAAAIDDAAGSEHIPEIPREPIRKRGRPVKVTES